MDTNIAVTVVVVSSSPWLAVAVPALELGRRLSVRVSAASEHATGLSKSDRRRRWRPSSCLVLFTVGRILALLLPIPFAGGFGRAPVGRSGDARSAWLVVFRVAVAASFGLVACGEGAARACMRDAWAVGKELYLLQQGTGQQSYRARLQSTGKYRVIVPPFKQYHDTTPKNSNSQVFIKLDKIATVHKIFFYNHFIFRTRFKIHKIVMWIVPFYDFVFFFTLFMLNLFFVGILI
jgi:hypothetical protein